MSGIMCGNGPVAEFRVSVLPSAPEYTLFSGRCGSGTGDLASVGTGQNYTATAPVTPATPVVTPASNSATWDGSTPFVD